MFSGEVLCLQNTKCQFESDHRLQRYEGAVLQLAERAGLDPV